MAKTDKTKQTNAVEEVVVPKLDPKIKDVIDFLTSTKAFVPDHYKLAIDHKIRELLK